MKLPHRENAYVPAKKLSDYLLSETHPVGRLKSRFFRSMGFAEANIGFLEQQLLALAYSEEVQAMVESPYGRKFIIEGYLQTPAGLSVSVRSVWILEADDVHPRFVTAYPV
ncbi:MAG: hypothetical protein FJ134_05055 [Deltaproteobacteria bacterium]|nr:hypothetical protein [Deltaproteobacteria bacterium]